MNWLAKWEQGMRRLDELPPRWAWPVGVGAFMILGLALTRLPSWHFGLGLLGLCGLLIWLALSGEPVVQLPSASLHRRGPDEQRPERIVILPLQENLEMIELPDGEFWMGSPQREKGRYADEVRHRVRLSAFAMAKYPVTQHLYKSIMGVNPSLFLGGARPVEKVSWFEAVRFCNKLSELAGLQPCYQVTEAQDETGRVGPPQVVWSRGADGYRLPTEAEWEYSCRAGTQSAYSFGDETEELGEYAWFAANSGRSTQEVGQKKANNWGVHDLHGNIWEWCWDWYEPYKVTDDNDMIVNPVGPPAGKGRVVRGGSFNSGPRVLRAAFRNKLQPEEHDRYLGFRCVRGSRRKP